MALFLGVATVGLAGADAINSALAASGTAALGASHHGLDAAMLVAELGRPVDRVTHRRSAASKWALAMVVLVSLAITAAGLARWSEPSSEVATRSVVLPWSAPPRAPPFLSPALS